MPCSDNSRVRDERTSSDPSRGLFGTLRGGPVELNAEGAVKEGSENNPITGQGGAKRRPMESRVIVAISQSLPSESRHERKEKEEKKKTES